MKVYKVGDLVKAEYKTGDYIGEVAEEPGRKVAVRVLAVLKHPDQGNLHYAQTAEVPFFHQRRALANKEIALMPLETVFPYSGTVPDYAKSLRNALHAEMDALRSAEGGMAEYARRALHELESLKDEYFAGQ